MVDTLTPQLKSLTDKFRLTVTDVFKSVGSSHLACAGRVLSGSVAVGDTLTVLPSFQAATVKSTSSRF
eukprot:m.291651 g.291651  ORF g.291651 m.291651 type:complete len:68 (+) comp15828_c0_seq3:1344-1547(+)